MLKKILVAIDGSEGSRRAATFAQQLAQQTGAHVTLVTAIHLPASVPILPFDGWISVMPSPSAAQLVEAQRSLEAFAASLPKNQVEARVELGEPTEVITKLAEDLQVDLVVLGARGLTPSERFLVGSVSDRIVRHCKRPVTIVK